MGLYNGKTTTTMLLLFSDPDSVDGESSGFGTTSNHELSSGSFLKLMNESINQYIIVVCLFVWGIDVGWIFNIY